jgi:hypothetical protein
MGRLITSGIVYELRKKRMRATIEVNDGEVVGASKHSLHLLGWSITGVISAAIRQGASVTRLETHESSRLPSLQETKSGFRRYGKEPNASLLWPVRRRRHKDLLM